jgi:hypothetical protein
MKICQIQNRISQRQKFKLKKKMLTMMRKLRRKKMNYISVMKIIIKIIKINKISFKKIRFLKKMMMI